MKNIPTRKFYIELETDEMIDALTTNMIDSPIEGCWRIDIQPANLLYREVGLEPEHPAHFKPKWHQSGNMYPPDAGYISELGVEAFFDQEMLHDAGALFDPHEIADDEELVAAISYFKEIANQARLPSVIDVQQKYSGNEVQEYIYEYIVRWA